MPPLPVSRSRADKIGKNLANGVGTSDDERDFRAILMAFDEAKDAAQKRLEAIGVKTTGRTKTRSTLLEKVGRGTSLKSVQDIAGLRVVVDGGLAVQDKVAAQICAEYEADGYKVLDRRAEPMHGYRALHVVVQQGGLSVEVQVRTPLQDGWAQMSEKFGDLWGRAARYTGMPSNPDQPAIAGATDVATRGEVWAGAMEVSEAIAFHENQELEMTVGGTIDSVGHLLQDFEGSIRRWIASMERVADIVQRLESRG